MGRAPRGAGSPRAGWGELGVAGDHPVGERLQLLGVRRGGPLVRAPLGEQRHHVDALGAEGGVEHAGDAAVRERPRRPAAGLGVLEGLLDVAGRQRQLDGAGVVLLRVGTRVGGEVGQLGQGEVDLDHAAAGAPPLQVGHEVVGQLGPVDLLQEGQLGVLKRLLPGR
jgi:hypothetical protein